MEKIQPLLEKRMAVARVTVTRVNLDVVHTVETLLDAGFVEVGCSPVDAKNDAYDLDHAAYERLLDGFQILVRRYLDKAAVGERYGFSNLTNILKAIHNGHNKQYPCGAGIQMVAAAPDGKMSLCHRFVGEPDYVLGSLQEGGLDKKKRLQVLEDIALKERSDCSTCWQMRTSSVRSPLGAGVKDTRIVSPIPSLSKIDNPAADATIPFDPMPASVRPRCSG
jgi:uncharacterized protein